MSRSGQNGSLIIVGKGRRSGRAGAPRVVGLPPTRELLLGDVRAVLRARPAGSVDVVITSIPYWNLRSYGTPPQVWGGLEDCDHAWVDGGKRRRNSGGGMGKHARASHANGKAPPRRSPYPTTLTAGQRCATCDAWFGELGQEPDWREYIEHVVEAFREVYRVLRRTGTAWVNVGDCFYGSTGRKLPGKAGKLSYRPELVQGKSRADEGEVGGMREKEAMLLPARIAIALHDEGWMVRKPHVWYKPNGLPDATEDRYGLRHEYVFHLFKNNQPVYWTHPSRQGVTSKPKPDYYWRNPVTREEREAPPPGWRLDAPEVEGERWTRLNRWEGHDYFFDLDAVRVPLEDERGPGRGQRAFNLRVQRAKSGKTEGEGFPGVQATDHELASYESNGTLRSLDEFAVGLGEAGAEAGPEGHGAKFARGADQGEVQRELRSNGGEDRKNLENAAKLAAYRDSGRDGHPGGKNPGDVWNVANAWGIPVLEDIWEVRTKPFHEAHFATFPEELPRGPVRAACPERVCTACGTPWTRRYVKELRSRRPNAKETVERREAMRTEHPERGQITSRGVASGYNVVRPGQLVKGCACRAPWEPGVVLDPFAGSGTVGVVAADEGRSFILIDVSETFAAIARRRLKERLTPVTSFVSRWRAKTKEVLV